ncbi:MAG: outer membrane beta-barrel protein [Legionella sp.]|nr:outer membrane beta-barrel protein [Legionella sp.]
MRPIVILTGGATTALGQKSQSLFFANTLFNYSPNQANAFKPTLGGFIGAEYSFSQVLAWQFGAAFYQSVNSSSKGEETQAPILSLAAINTWNYQYKIVSRQLLAENKLLFTLHEHYRPYLIIGLGEGFNKSYKFQVTPQNQGEVATATFASHNNKSFIYTTGLGLDVSISNQLRLGAGYRFAYLGKYDLGKGILDTGAGGAIFYLPALESTYCFNHQAVIQLTYLF